MATADVRGQMIEQQVRAWDVLDERVLAVLRKLPREQFVPESQRFLAYADAEVPLAHGQHMLRPSVVGRLLQALALTGVEQVLEVGTGTGFVTACLAQTAKHVRSLEIFADLAAAARANLAASGTGNVEIMTEDALQLTGTARYDAIAVTGSLPIPDDLFQKQLAVGGRLFLVVGDPPVMEALLIRRVTETAFTTQTLFETVIDPLVNARHPPTFTF
jgi:protein-L-isoaspartate(D-aspartate) O-methyltransferase